MRPLFGLSFVSVAACLIVGFVNGPVRAQTQLTSGVEELQTVQLAKQTLDEFGGLQIESIPPRMFGAAEGIAIFPNMIKGGFILGVNYGKGLLMVRRPDRTWSPPVMCTMGGGSLGFQAGVQAADIVLVFATPRSLAGVLNGQKVTLGADANVALGPIGRSAEAGTDARLGAEIYSYARSRGLFLGVSVNGASLSVDNNANSMLYGRFGVTPTDVFQDRGLAFHPEIKALIDDLNMRSHPPTVPVPGEPLPGAVPAAVQSPVAAQPAVIPATPLQPAVPVPAPVPVATPAPAAGVYAPVPPATAGQPGIVIPPLVPVK
jgi:lipid-binding SYLF domain-containing protein